MNMTKHERPGVYSSYDASSVVSAGSGAKTVGVAARAAKGVEGAVATLTGYTEGVGAFGEDAGAAGMSAILRLLFLNGVSKVAAVRVADGGTVSDYTAGFDALGGVEDVRIMVCDSTDAAVHQALRTAVETSSAGRKERIAVVGAGGATVAELTTHAAELNSERMVLTGPDGMVGESAPSGVLCAAAMAGAMAGGSDPAAPLNGAALYGLSGLSAEYGDNDVDVLVRGGVTPLESVAGVISPVRCVTTRTTTDGTADATWRELSTIRIVDDVIPAVRSSLRSKFSRTKNTAQNRGAIRSQVIVELEKKAGGGDHRQLRRGAGERVGGRPHRVPCGIQLCGGPRAEPDLPDGPHHGVSGKQLSEKEREPWRLWDFPPARTFIWS